MLSARELNSASLPNRTWVNERLTFTHGYGLTLGPVNQVTSEGLPVLFVRNLPPETIPDLPIDEPSIYFGELSNDYVIVRTDTPRVPLPARRRQRVDAVRRHAAACRSARSGESCCSRCGSASYQILLSDDISAESRILFNRNIRERVERMAPFLAFDRDPYLVLADGRLFWIYDAYTTSNRYPYSTPAGDRVNYIRNSVKFVIDAYDGTTTVYLADAQGSDCRDLRADLPRHVQAARRDAGGAARARALSGRHLRDSVAGLRDVSHDAAGGVLQPRGSVGDPGDRRAAARRSAMQPYYTIMRLPGETGGRVHPDAAVHAAPARQPRGVARGAQRRRALRTAARLRVPEAEAGLRPAAGRRAHQPGPDDLAADHAVEPAGIAGDLGHADGDSDRGVADLRAAAVPAGAGRTHPRADARHRRLREPDRDGGDARGGSRAALRHRRASAAGGTGRTRARRRRRPRTPPARPPSGAEIRTPALAAEARGTTSAPFKRSGRRLGEVRRGASPARSGPRPHASPRNQESGIGTQANPES